MTPANGTNAPQSRFCNAIAKANSSRVQPLAIVIGGRNRPIVWRTPMASIRISAAQMSTVRVDFIVVGYRSRAGEGPGSLDDDAGERQRLTNSAHRLHALCAFIARRAASFQPARRELLLDGFLVVARGARRSHEAPEYFR